METEKATQTTVTEGTNPVSKIDKLREEIAENTELLRKNTDPKRIIGRGLLYGLSTVVGATILVGIAYSFIDYIPILGDKIRELSVIKRD